MPSGFPGTWNNYHLTTTPGELSDSLGPVEEAVVICLTLVLG